MFVKRFFSDGFIRDGFVMLCFGMLANFFNYVFQFLMVRFLGPSDYAVLASIVAIFYIVSIFSISMSLGTSRFVSRNKGELSVIRKILKFAIFFGLLLLITFSLLSGEIASFLHIKDSSLLIFVGLVAFFSLVYPVFIGAFNAVQNFFLQGLLHAMVPILKVLFAAVLVFLGFSVLGAVFGVLIASSITVFAGFFLLRAYIFKTSEEHSQIKSRELILDLLPTFLAQALLILLINIDVLLVKHFFSLTLAGFYAAASVLGKIIWFEAAGLSSVLFPKASLLKINPKGSLQLLFKTMILSSVLVVPLLLIYFFFPDFIVSLLFGSDYIISHLVFPFGALMFLFSMIELVVIYKLAVSDYSFVPVTFIALFLQISIIWFFHSSLQTVLIISLIAFSLCLFFNVVPLFVKYFSLKE